MRYEALIISLLKGGLSYFSEKRGFVADNVVNFEVILASGEIVNANAREKSDLCAALKGGSNNFGIVSRIELPTFEQGRMWRGALYYENTTFPQLFKAFNDFTTDCSDDNAHVIIAAFWAQGREAGTSDLYYARTQSSAPPCLRPFVDIAP